MDKKALRKEFFMSVKKTKNRFISICLIVALGTAFYAGIRAANPDMQQSADQFFDQSRLMDIRVLSELGLTDQDVLAIRGVEGVETVQPSYSADVLTTKDDQQLVLRLMSRPDDMNLITVDEGRLPQNSGECLVDNLLIMKNGYKIGDTIEIRSGDADSDLSETVDVNKYKIVGRGRTALYLHVTRDSSNIGNGAVSGFMIIPGEDFNMKAYTEIGVRVEGMEALDCYSEAYKQGVERVVDNIEAVSSGRCEARYDEVIIEANNKISDARHELEDAKSKLEDAQKEIQDGERKLNDAIKTVDSEEKKLNESKALIVEKEKTLNTGMTQLAEGWKSYFEAVADVEQGEIKIAKARAELDKKADELEAAQKLLDDANKQFESAQTELDLKRQDIYTKAEQLNSLKTTREELESQALVLAKMRADFEAQKPELETKLAQLKVQMDALQIQIEGELDEQKKGELQNQYADLKSAYDEGKASIEQTDKELSEKEEAVERALAQLPSMEEIDGGLSQISKAIQEIDSAQELLDRKKQEADLDGKAQIIEEGKQAIYSARVEIDLKSEQLKEAGKALQKSYEMLTAQEKKVKEGQEKIAEAKRMISDGQRQIAEAKAEIDSNVVKISDAKEEYEKAKEEHMPDILQGEHDIEAAEKSINDIKVPEWYVLDREYIQTCVEYAQDAERIGAIGRVFPVIFFLVAALVSLTTMTRMVEEERTQIGTLKALGYGKISIAAKYILYAFTATMIGGVFGTIIGQKLLPYVIMNAYGIVYITLTEFVTPLHMSFTVTSILAAVASTILAVMLACYKELRAVPAQLMRPEAPKAGKRVLLERVPFIWKHLSFSNKSTVRNLFRYKKRFFMTVIGIGGCMGLLLVGYGVKDSIMTIGDKQFNEIRIYDGNISLSGDATEAEKKQVYEEIKNEDNVASVMFAHEETVDVSIDSRGRGARSTYLFVPSELERMPEFVNLRDRRSKEQYMLDDEGAIISEKLAKLLDVSEGDDVYIDTGNMHRVKVKISHIVENYFFHYIYMSPMLYERVYGETPQYTEIFMKNDYSDKSYEEAFSRRYLEKSAISGITFIRSTSDRIREMIGSMDVIIYVIIISAGMLAFVVLYNLNNINISERRRELATLKVLGFYDLEVSKYVFRENILLTFFGSIFGIFLGVILHRYVILTAEIDMMMFGRNIYFRSYIMSIVLTFAFSLIVNAVTHWKLKKIDMIESLKSVE